MGRMIGCLSRGAAVGKTARLPTIDGTMTAPPTGTSGIFTARRAECEAAIAELAEGGEADPKQIASLRRQFGDELAGLVISIAALQAKAQRRFGGEAFGSPVWWVTEKSLQQATAWQVARLKSCWFDDRMVYDLCSGVGGDAIHLAQRGGVVAVDADSRIAEMAAANLDTAGSSLAETRGLAEARGSCADARAVEIPPRAAIHIDPDRRGKGQRVSSPQRYQPSWSEVMEIIGKTDHAVVKLAPAARVESTYPGDTHRCWISLSGTVREQSLLVGHAVACSGRTPQARSAVRLSADGNASWFEPTLDEIGLVKAAIAGKPSALLIDPDASIRAAGLTEAYAAQNRFSVLGKPSGFLTSDAAGPSANDDLAVVGKVIWSGACDDRKLRREFRSRGVFPASVKVRGTDHDPAVLVRRYRQCGDQPVTLWIGRTLDRVFAAITGD